MNFRCFYFGLAKISTKHETIDKCIFYAHINENNKLGVYDLNMHDVRFEVFFLFFRTYLTASDCVQIIYRQEWLCTHCATKKWLQHVSCVTYKDEEEKEKSVEKRNANIHGKSGREKASERVTNK